MKNKVVVGAAVGLLSIGALAGCSGSPQVQTVTETETVYETPDQDVASIDDLYIINARAYYGNSDIIYNASDQQLLEVGYAACTVLDEGYTIEDVIMTLMNVAETGDDAEALGWLVGAAIAQLCPEYSYMIE